MTPQDTASLGEYEAALANALDELRDERIVERMWEGDRTGWGPEPDEISDRLVWLRSPEETERALPEILGLAEAVREEGIERVLLLTPPSGTPSSRVRVGRSRPPTTGGRRRPARGNTLEYVLLARPLRRWALAPCIVTRARHPQHPAQRRDRKGRLLPSMNRNRLTGSRLPSRKRRAKGFARFSLDLLLLLKDPVLAPQAPEFFRAPRW
jgi:hypothetical protein